MKQQASGRSTHESEGDIEELQHSSDDSNSEKSAKRSAKRKRKLMKQQGSRRSIYESEDGSEEESSSLVRVAVTHNSVRCKWDKKHYCKFCMIAQSKISRHMFLKHMDEAEVAAVACMPLERVCQ